MRPRTTNRGQVPAWRGYWLFNGLACALVAGLLFHYQAPAILTGLLALGAAAMGVLGLRMPSAERSHRSAVGTDGREAAGHAPAGPGRELNPPVSRLRIGLFSALFALFAALARWLGAPTEVVSVLVLCALLYAVVMLLPDRVRRLLAWDLNLR